MLQLLLKFHLSQMNQMSLKFRWHLKPLKNHSFHLNLNYLKFLKNHLNLKFLKNRLFLKNH